MRHHALRDERRHVEVGPDPNGFMTGTEVVEFPQGYARSFGAPVHTGVEVLRVCPGPVGWRVETDAGAIDADAVVVATGDLARPRLPDMAAAFAPGLRALHAGDYRGPTQCSRAPSWWSAPDRPGSRSPASSPPQAAACTSRSGGTSACPGATAAATPTGGWTVLHCNRRREAVRAAGEAVVLREGLGNPAALGRALATASLQQWTDLQVLAAASTSAERAVRLLEPAGDSAALALRCTTYGCS